MQRAIVSLILGIISYAPRAVNAAEPDVPTELADYVSKKDDAFAWKQKGKIETNLGTVYDLQMTSQKWQGANWEHAIQVFVPKGAKPRATMMIYNTGGGPNPATSLLGLAVAGKIGAPIAFVFNIPNQPIFNKKEDALIAETLCKYLETKDASWPLLFPMAKSIVRGMDALQAFAKAEWDMPIKDFIITGASKRGWTSWMTAASGDKRVKAIAPMVIDTLNMTAQMPNQLKSFGSYSTMIHDYTERGLVKENPNPLEAKLWRMIDPWTYRANLKLPKLIINGTNDPYWTLDALNLYWDDLVGDKWVLYVPNAGHGLDQDHGNGAKDREHALNTLAAFARYVIDDKPFPTPTWKHLDEDGVAVLKLDGGKDVKKISIWQADADTRDFRKSKWKEQTVKLEGTAGKLPLTAPERGCRATFADFEYQIGELTFTLSSQVRILEAKAK